MQLSIFKSVRVFFAILFILASATNSNAQDKPTVEKRQFKINILIPAVVFEYGLNDKNTLYSELSAGIGFLEKGPKDTDIVLLPSITGQFRHYYNLEKRSQKGKVTAHNSGGFVALAGTYYLKSIHNDRPGSSFANSLVIAPVWGFQRTYKGNFNLGLEMGVGYVLGNSNDSDNGITPVLNFSLGWVIGK